MKYLTIALMLLIFNTTFGQTTYTVSDFSRDYFGKIFISDTAQVFSEGWIAIYEKESKKQIIKVNSDELALSLHSGQVLANIKELPYGEQSLIMYDDFNFDGIKDFAIEDGQKSCYHLPSFQIYLANQNGFTISDDFTRLAQEYYGMFEVNYTEKRINTMTKSGCCWHEYSEFIVENNKPKAVKIKVDDQSNFPFNMQSEKIWNGTKMLKTSKKTIDLKADGIIIVLSFKVEKKEKEIVLFNINNRTLNYAVIDKKGSVEFSYPLETIYKNQDFKFDSKGKTLTFKNKNTTYSIYDQESGIGINIITGGKTYNWIGNNSTKEGNLNELNKLNLDNVIIY
jgi:hypothetical protein